ncbi:MAG: hypothetical protein IPK65_12395 [Gammaproteobacteria bacterium]|nr:hypothetical protein [Gammaproteobacteria bacterium]
MGAIELRISPKWNPEPQDVTYSEDPVQTAMNLSKSLNIKIDGEVDGLIDGSRIAIFRSDSHFKSITGGNVSLTSGASSKRFFDFFFKGMESNDPDSGYSHKKLGIALELYGAFFSEATPNARFLTLVMVLESLAESEERPKAVLDLLKKFKSQIEEIERNYSDDTNERVSLDSLKRELTHRKEDSIRKQIRSLVFNTISKNGDNDALAVSRQALEIYDKRSTLVHEGYLSPRELGEVSADARRIVERVLRAKFAQLVGIDNV